MKHFCTCQDLSCPMHPTNHDKGCTPCIAKNLKLNEIPSCFFNKVCDAHNMSSFTFEDFAKIFIDSNKDIS
ncbi:MAG: DUF6485 family protein [Erysipelotrichaceae bacterium]|nr:DUF6485 family protein [Erysipelotrichaceae bacterium]